MSSKRYPEEFEVEAVRQVVERDHSVAEVASRLGMAKHSLYSWKLKYGPRSDEQQAKTSDEMEIKQLKKELKRVTEVRDVLKRSRGVLRQPVRMRYAYIRANSTAWPVRPLRDLLDVHPNGYWRGASSYIRPEQKTISIWLV